MYPQLRYMSLTESKLRPFSLQANTITEPNQLGPACLFSITLPLVFTSKGFPLPAYVYNKNTESFLWSMVSSSQLLKYKEKLVRTLSLWIVINSYCDLTLMPVIRR